MIKYSTEITASNRDDAQKQLNDELNAVGMPSKHWDQIRLSVEPRVFNGDGTPIMFRFSFELTFDETCQ